MKKVFLIISSVILLAACGSEEASHNHQHGPVKKSSSKHSSEFVSDPGQAEVSIDIAGGDDMKYSLSSIKVKAGQKIKLTLNHTGNMPKSTMGHNFVLLQKDVNLGDFAREALKHQDNDFIPKDTKDVIVYTKMIGGGESTTVEFQAPETGTYEYLCTFTGHSAMMRGKFIVE